MLCLFVTFCNLPSIVYFLSSDYAHPPPDGAFWLRGSAVCDAIEGTVHVGTLNRTVETIQNPCPFTKKLGTFGMLSVVGLAFFLVAIRCKLSKEMEQMDEKCQTAQDYSILVKDPDPDARDPDEWYQFFSQFGEVASVTVALKNGQFLNDLARQRYVRLMVDYEAPGGTHPFEEMDSNAGIHEPTWMKHEVRANGEQARTHVAEFVAWAQSY